jgi:hypothetical protein
MAEAINATQISAAKGFQNDARSSLSAAMLGKRQKV